MDCPLPYSKQRATPLLSALIQVLVLKIKIKYKYVENESSNSKNILFLAGLYNQTIQELDLDRYGK